VIAAKESLLVNHEIASWLCGTASQFLVELRVIGYDDVNRRAMVFSVFPEDSAGASFSFPSRCG